VASSRRKNSGPDAVAGLWEELLPLAGTGLRLERDAPLGRRTTLRVGGPVDLLVLADTAAAFVKVVAAAHRAGVPCLVLGQGSNVLVPDEGLRGVVCVLGGELERVELEGDRVTAGGACILAKVARMAAKNGLAGLEALAGFPATVGGAVFMNAGCYGTEIVDLLEHVDVVEPDGERRRLGVAELEASYRSTVLQRRGSFVLAATFRLRPGDPAAILQRMDELNRRRWASLPSGRPNAGSIFKNPAGDFAGRLVEAAGLKGARHGGAAWSERHGNVIVNEGDARASDVMALMTLARGRVRERFGVELEPELRLLGSLGDDWRREEGKGAAGDVEPPGVEPGGVG
jgi:UDP-N-acetylmuramate dehydrogenase